MQNHDNTLLISSNNNDDNTPEQENGLTLTKQGKLGINTLSPTNQLDVNGTVSCSGRIGTFNSSNGEMIKVAADGEWHELIGDLCGCNAFEIIAGVGKKRSGKYALMHAVTINIFGNRGKTRYTQSCFMSRNDSIRLKWVGNRNKYRLMIRTLSDYGSENQNKINVNCSITKLWFDEFMNDCVSNRE